MVIPATFRRDKFRELIVYIAHECAGDEGFGDVHFNKALFFSDAFALQYLGKSITNARYQKLAFGPAARALLPVRDELIAEGDVEVLTVGFNTKKTCALRPPDTALFSEEELSVVDQVITLFCGKKAWIVAEEAHINSPGWNLVESGEDIPLESQLISQVPVARTTLERGRELAVKFGW